MFRVLRRIAIGLGLMAVGAAIVLAVLYRAATAPVPEYQELLEATRTQRDSGELDRGRQELESQLAAVYSDAQTARRWQAAITADQINGWLATRLKEVLPELAERGVTEPRVMIGPGAGTLAMQIDFRGISGVLLLKAEPFVADDGWLALELVSAHLGKAPLPTGSILQEVRQKLPKNVPLRLSQNGGRPVLLFDFERLVSTPDRVRTIDAIELVEGELRVAGSTKDREPRIARVVE